MPLKFFVHFFFILLLFSPLHSYYALNSIGITSQKYMSILAIFISLLYITFSSKKITIPGFTYFLMIFIFYKWLQAYILGDLGIRDLVTGQNTAIAFLIILIYNFNFKKKFIDRCNILIAITIIFAVIVSVIQVFDADFFNAYLVYFKDSDVLIEKGLYTSRRSSIFGFIDLNEVGIGFLSLLSVFIGHSIISKKQNFLLFIFLGGIVAVLTNGRYVMIGFVIITLQLLLYQKNIVFGFMKYIIIIFISLFILVQVLNFFEYNLNEWYQTRLFAEGAVEETTRYKAFGNFAIFFPQYPIFGSGGMTDEIKFASELAGSYQIHVGYLSALVYYGFVGCFFLFGFWFLLLRFLYKNAKKTGYWGSFFGFLIFIWANFSLVMFHFFFIGTIMALVFDKYYMDKYKQEQLLLIQNKPDVS